jgi:hypothetical protein
MSGRGRVGGSHPTRPDPTRPRPVPPQTDRSPIGGRATRPPRLPRVRGALRLVRPDPAGGRGAVAPRLQHSPGALRRPGTDGVGVLRAAGARSAITEPAGMVWPDSVSQSAVERTKNSCAAAGADAGPSGRRTRRPSRPGAPAGRGRVRRCSPGRRRPGPRGRARLPGAQVVELAAAAGAGVVRLHRDPAPAARVAVAQQHRLLQRRVPGVGLLLLLPRHLVLAGGCGTARGRCRSASSACGRAAAAERDDQPRRDAPLQQLRRGRAAGRGAGSPGG